MKVSVIGSGESGVGAALLAKKMGYEIFVSDGGKIKQEYKDVLAGHGIGFEESSHDFVKLSNVDLVVKSPGIPDEAPIVKQLMNAGLKVISEIEFGYMHYKGKVLAITGSNGKTTTSGLLFHILHQCGKDVQLGGNYGESFAGIVATSQPELMVVEVSSFQLDNIDTFKPYIGILLNITPDHLDRYSYSIEKYADAKFRLIENMEKDDLFIYNAEDQIINEKLKIRQVNASLAPIQKEDYLEGLPRLGGGELKMNLPGRHNRFNAACVVAACRRLGLTEDEIEQGLTTFENVPHRMEFVATINGVDFMNDSKATNVDSVFYALEAIKKPIVWIAGGTDKGNDYTPLFDQVTEKVKALICLGIDNDKLKKSFQDKIKNITETRDVRECVNVAMDFAKPGDVVLLSPACASFDLFLNYIDRGDQFKASIMDLKDRIGVSK